MPGFQLSRDGSIGIVNTLLMGSMGWKSGWRHRQKRTCLLSVFEAADYSLPDMKAIDILCAVPVTR
jgi:hypothetical protein